MEKTDLCSEEVRVVPSQTASDLTARDVDGGDGGDGDCGDGSDG